MEYDENKPYLKDIINDIKKSDACEIQLTIAINNSNFILLKTMMKRV